MQEFTVSELQAVQDAVAAKLASFEAKGITGEHLVKKLQFEAQWVQDNKKYPTWQVAQQAYNKKLAEVQKDIALKALQPDVMQMMSVKTKSPQFKAMLSELTQAYSDGDIPKVQQLISDMQAKAAAMQRRQQQYAAKHTQTDWDAETYSQKRKDAAMWIKDESTNRRETDKILRQQTSDIWLTSSETARDAAYSYTEGSCYLNEPLRNMSYTGRKGTSNFKSHCNALTDMIARAKRPFDYWVQRGDYEHAFGLRFGINLSDYASNPQALVGKIATESGFLSTGSTKGTGFSSYPVISNIYCPRGTEGLYCEPFSHYGYDVNGQGNYTNGAAGRHWDGKSPQRHFGGEFETLLQRGTTFRITKAYYGYDKNGKKHLFVDMEVIKQEYARIE